MHHVRAVVALGATLLLGSAATSTQAQSGMCPQLTAVVEHALNGFAALKGPVRQGEYHDVTLKLPNAKDCWLSPRIGGEGTWTYWCHWLPDTFAGLHDEARRHATAAAQCFGKPTTDFAIRYGGFDGSIYLRNKVTLNWASNAGATDITLTIHQPMARR